MVYRCSDERTGCYERGRSTEMTDRTPSAPPERRCVRNSKTHDSSGCRLLVGLYVSRDVYIKTFCRLLVNGFFCPIHVGHVKY